MKLAVMLVLAAVTLLSVQVGELSPSAQGALLQPLNV